MINLKNPTDLKRLCLVTAVDIEFKTATALLSEKTFSADSKFKICRGVVGSRAVTVLQCGMGAHGFAEWLAEHLKTNAYDALIVVGLAGGLDLKLKAGDAVVYDLCRDERDHSELPNSQTAHCNKHLTESLFQSLQAADVRSFRGAGITTSRIITDSNEKLSLGASRKALAVDMESFDVLSVCAETSLPTAVLRVISDEAGSDLPDFNSAADPGGKLNPGRLAMAFARRPTASLCFLRSLKPVIAALGKALEVVVRV